MVNTPRVLRLIVLATGKPRPHWQASTSLRVVGRVCLRGKPRMLSTMAP
jgi:hypothetical protein